jgi:hypothetical protein
VTARRPRGEQGQLSLALLAVILTIFAAAIGMLAFGEASDSRGRAQKAADAAALGAAVRGRDALAAAIARPDGGSAFHGNWLGVAPVSGAQGVGCAAAASWAARNSGSTLTRCRYNGPDEFAVETLSRPSGERNLRGTAEATASLNSPKGCQVSHYTTSGYDYHEVVVCTGPDGATAKVDYITSSGYSIFYIDPPKIWQSTFRVRLTR